MYEEHILDWIIVQIPPTQRDWSDGFQAWAESLNMQEDDRLATLAKYKLQPRGI